MKDSELGKGGKRDDGASGAEPARFVSWLTRARYCRIRPAPHGRVGAEGLCADAPNWSPARAASAAAEPRWPTDAE